MDWQDERYVRLFTRDTPEWCSWPWEARALFPLLMRKVDRGGELGLGRLGARGVSSCVALPEEVCRVGLEALVDTGTIEMRGQVLWIRNFQPAQEATMSNAAKVRDHRERKRAKWLKSLDVDVTGCNSMKPDVTGCNSMKPDVTPSLAEPSLASKEALLSSGDDQQVRDHREMKHAKWLKSLDVDVTGCNSMKPDVTPSLAEPSLASKEALLSSGDDQPALLDELAPTEQPTRPERERLVELWNQTAAPELPRLRGLTGDRAKKADRLLKVVPLDDWPKLIANANASDFCRGMTDGGWKLSLAAMLKTPELALKVLEGNYANGKGRLKAGYQDVPEAGTHVQASGWEELDRKMAEKQQRSGGSE